MFWCDLTLDDYIVQSCNLQHDVHLVHVSGHRPSDSLLNTSLVFKVYVQRNYTGMSMAQQAFSVLGH